MLSVSRQDAIGFQLDTAIRLWFEDSDPISAHSLASSALGIAHDVATHFGKAAMLWGGLPKNLFAAAREAQNFFKHADKDPSKVLPFNSKLTTYHIYDAALLYSALYLSFSAPMGTFLLWLSVHEPKIFGTTKLSPPLAKRLEVSLAKSTLVDLKREEFWSKVWPVMAKRGK